VLSGANRSACQCKEGFFAALNQPGEVGTHRGTQGVPKRPGEVGGYETCRFTYDMYRLLHACVCVCVCVCVCMYLYMYSSPYL
jgi:hypothetical protein